MKFAPAKSTLKEGHAGMELEIPEPLRLREEAICAPLRYAAGTGGMTAEAAELLEAILLPHLAKERADILRPLALLPSLARGAFSPEMAEVLPKIDELKQHLHELQIEHATILSAIKRLVAAAREEGKSQHARFAERLLFRAWLDESVFSALAILIGKYVQLRLHPSATSAEAEATVRRLIEFQVPESLRLDHAQLSAALSNAAQAAGRTRIAAEKIVQLLEAHVQKEDREVLQVLGLLAPLAKRRVDLAAEDLSRLDDLELSQCALNRQHAALAAAGEQLLAIAREENAQEVLEFAEWLLLRIRLDEEILYPAALLIRNYLRIQGRIPSDQRVTVT
ncbi:MAG: hypothetical protein ACM3NN_08610 [Nitrospirota bacterium]